MTKASAKSKRRGPFARLLRLLAAVAVLAILLYLARAPLLGAMGNYLVTSEPPQAADLVLVLAGDSYGQRITTAGDLVRNGYAAKAMISGPSGAYGEYECEPAIRFAVRAGYPESYFLHAHSEARSTVEEAHDVLPYLHEQKARRVLLVTSNFHTRRSAKIFRQAAPDIHFTIIAAPAKDFDPDSWWTTRQGRKTAFYEWMKTFAELVGM